MGLCKGDRTGKSVDDRVGMMLRDSVWREVRWKWEVEAQERSELGVMQRLPVHGSKDRCMDVTCKRLRKMLAMLGGGTTACTENGDCMGDGMV